MENASSSVAEIKNLTKLSIFLLKSIKQSRSPMFFLSFIFLGLFSLDGHLIEKPSFLEISFWLLKKYL